jgi:hypothetical protein
VPAVLVFQYAQCPAASRPRMSVLLAEEGDRGCVTAPDAVTLERMGWVVTSIGAVLTTLVGILVGSILGNRSQQRQWSRDRQADACAQVLRESSNVMIELGKQSSKRIEAAPDRISVPSQIDWRPWNEALAMVALLANHDIVEAAIAIDAEFWPAHVQIKRGWTSDGDWPKLRSHIETRREDFVNVARKYFAASGPRLSRLTGKPSADDAFWEFRRSYYSPDRNLGHVESPDRSSNGQ